MLAILKRLFQKLGIKSFKPVQTIDFSLLAGKLSKNNAKNLEKK